MVASIVTLFTTLPVTEKTYRFKEPYIETTIRSLKKVGLTYRLHYNSLS